MKETNAQHGQRGRARPLRRLVRRAVAFGAMLGSAAEIAAAMRDASPERQAQLARTWAESLEH